MLAIMRHLTDRQRDVLRMAATGMTHADLARALGVSEQTVKNHLTTAYRTLEVRNQTQAFVALGWLKPPRRRS